MLKKRKRVSLKVYWMTRYLIVLAIGLAIVALISAIWIRHTNVQYRLDTMNFIAEESVNRITDATNNNREVPNGMLDDEQRFQRQAINPRIYIVNTEGQILSKDTRGPQLLQNIPKSILESEEEKQEITEMNGQTKTYYIVKKKIELDDKQVGWVIVLESEDAMTYSNQAYGQLAWMIAALALIGLGAIYYLTSRLAKPIKEVALAAKQVQQGNYAIELPNNSKEAEVYDLMTSFKEMASRLEQLESMRTELLAGVTHELKTPVTAIDGILQALKDGVVTGDEAREFILMAMVETKKMKTMVGDLLAFNSFAVNAIPIKIESREINQFVKESIKQWQKTQEFKDVKIILENNIEEVILELDPVRFQQIFTNLFTNAAQAMHEYGNIKVSLQSDSSMVRIFVQDEGKGIPNEEQTLIFDRFYRGENKKYAVRGLGLGLPLSKMMAQSIKGDLHLVHSDEQGTRFVLEITKVKKN